MRELSFAIATEKKVAKDYDILDIQNDEYYAHLNANHIRRY